MLLDTTTTLVVARSPESSSLSRHITRLQGARSSIEPLPIPAMKVSGIILAVLASALAAGASAPPPVDPAGAARGVVERVFGADMVPKFRFEKAPADPETGLDAYEIDYDTENEVVVIRGNT